MRLTRLLAVVSAAGLLCGALAGQAAQASQATQAALAGQQRGGQPSVGQCRMLTTTQANRPSNKTAPISCSKRHNSRVIAVPTLPKGVRWRDVSTDSKRYTMAVRLCFPAFAQAVGQSNAVRDRTAYSWLYFVPTASQRHNGQRWIRCDLTIRHGGSYGVLPTDRTPALRDASPPTRVARCLRKVSGSYQTTPCSAGHGFRAAGTFSVSQSRYPGKSALLQLGRSRCPKIVRTDTNFRWTWSNKTVWNHGPDHVVVCYNRTSR